MRSCRGLSRVRQGGTRRCSSWYRRYLVLLCPVGEDDPVTTSATARPAGTSPRDADELRRRELADFLRSRRERVAPGDVGLPQAGRRRPPRPRPPGGAAPARGGGTSDTWL